MKTNRYVKGEKNTRAFCVPPKIREWILPEGDKNNFVDYLIPADNWKLCWPSRNIIKKTPSKGRQIKKQKVKNRKRIEFKQEKTDIKAADMN